MDFVSSSLNTLSLLSDSAFEEPGEEKEGKTSGHKEESENRRKLDAADRNKIIQELKNHSNPLTADPDDRLANIINGRIAPEDVNVDNALAIGSAMLCKFMAHLPSGFHSPINKKVVTMESMKKKVNIEDASTYDMEKLYARLLILSQSRDIQLSDVFKHELSPVPSALFDEYGDMRKGNKATLVHKLAVFISVQLRYAEFTSTVDRR